MSKNKKVFSGLSRLPKGLASDQLTEGCIVLEGGAFRGLYTSGVLDALMEAGINLSCTVGVSAGALNGMNYVSGQIGRSGRLNLTYRHDSRYVGLKAIRKNRGVHPDPQRNEPHRAYFFKRGTYDALPAELSSGTAGCLEKNPCTGRFAEQQRAAVQAGM